MVSRIHGMVSGEGAGEVTVRVFFSLEAKERRASVDLNADMRRL